jgi:hypothetical protein
MKRIFLLLAVAIIAVTMVVFGVSMAGADPPEGAGCKGLLKAAKESGNSQVLENAFEHGCIKKAGPPPPPLPPPPP